MRTHIPLTLKLTLLFRFDILIVCEGRWDILNVAGSKGFEIFKIGYFTTAGGVVIKFFLVISVALRRAHSEIGHLRGGGRTGAFAATVVVGLAPVVVNCPLECCSSHETRCESRRE